MKPIFKMNYHSSESMPELKDKSVQIIVTSPPYNVKKNYENGYDDNIDWESYSIMLKKVFKESHRVLKNNGAMFVNIANNIKDPSKGVKILKMITDSGFYLMDTIMWLKKNPIPNTGLNFTNRYEIIYFLTKNKDIKKIKFNKLRISNDKIGLVDKWGRARKQAWRDIGNVWSFPVVKQGWFGNEGHCAMFPPDLPKLAILCASNKGDLVLDPFAGSGTTCQVALHLKRKCIGYEINRGYKKVIKDKITKTPKFNVKTKA